MEGGSMIIFLALSTLGSVVGITMLIIKKRRGDSIPATTICLLAPTWPPPAILMFFEQDILTMYDKFISVPQATGVLPI